MLILLKIRLLSKIVLLHFLKYFNLNQIYIKNNQKIYLKPYISKV